MHKGEEHGKECQSVREVGHYRYLEASDMLGAE